MVFRLHAIVINRTNIVLGIEGIFHVQVSCTNCRVAIEHLSPDVAQQFVGSLLCFIGRRDASTLRVRIDVVVRLTRIDERRKFIPFSLRVRLSAALKIDGRVARPKKILRVPRPSPVLARAGILS